MLTVFHPIGMQPFVSAPGPASQVWGVTASRSHSQAIFVGELGRPRSLPFSIIWGARRGCRRSGLWLWPCLSK